MMPDPARGAHLVPVRETGEIPGFPARSGARSYPGCTVPQRVRGAAVSGGKAMGVDPLQVPLEDEPLVEEITLLTDLIVAATEADGPLDQGAIDQALGLP